MSKFLTIALAALVLSPAANAASELRDAWISTSSFDGKEFRYSLTAYETLGPVDVQSKINCEYGRSGDSLILKSIEVKLLIGAEFNQPGSQVVKRGSVDVRKAIQDCQSVLPGGKNALRSPVAVKLPSISVPSEN